MSLGSAWWLERRLPSEREAICEDGGEDDGIEGLGLDEVDCPNARPMVRTKAKGRAAKDLAAGANHLFGWVVAVQRVQAGAVEAVLVLGWRWPVCLPLLLASSFLALLAALLFGRSKGHRVPLRGGATLHWDPRMWSENAKVVPIPSSADVVFRSTEYNSPTSPASPPQLPRQGIA